MPGIDPDWPVFRRILDGEQEEPLTILIEKYGPDLSNIFKRATDGYLNEADASIVYQEGVATVFLMLWKDRFSFDPGKYLVRDWIFFMGKLVALEIRSKLL